MGSSALWPKTVKGFFAQKDLERLRFQLEMGRGLESFEVNSEIVDRSKSIEVTKRVIEHIQRDWWSWPQEREKPGLPWP